MKKLTIIVLCMVLLSSCATIFCGSKAKVVIDDENVTSQVRLTVDGKTFNTTFPTEVKIKRGFSPSTVIARAEGYKDAVVVIDKTFNPVAIINLTDIIAWGIDAATGAIMKPADKYYLMHMQRVSDSQSDSYYEKDPTIVAGEASNRVGRDNAGQTALERTVIRWFFDSDPQGARVFYRVISSIPNEVKNTNETYLMTTPYEETRSFNILGLTYENSRDVQIEIKVVKAGYEPQIKRFNVRQAIDQQEISSFFMLVPKE